MTNLLQILNKLFQPSITVLERISSKAHWGLIILLLVVCYLFSLGSGVFYHIFSVFGDRSLTLQDITAIIVYSVPWAVVTPFNLCVFWVVQYLAIRLLRGQGSFLTHGWVTLVCFTPCIIALAGLAPLPINNIWILPDLLLLLGTLYMSVLNIWMMTRIHNVNGAVAFVSSLIGIVAIPAAFVSLVFFFLLFGIIQFPAQS